MNSNERRTKGEAEEECIMKGREQGKKGRQKIEKVSKKEEN